MLPGYKKCTTDPNNAIVDRYLENPKPQQVSLTFDDGESVTLPAFDLVGGYDKLDWQTRQLPKPVKTQYVKVTILSLYPGQDESNAGYIHPAAHDVSISEFHFWGWPASATGSDKAE